MEIRATNVNFDFSTTLSLIETLRKDRRWSSDLGVTEVTISEELSFWYYFWGLLTNVIRVDNIKHALHYFLI